MSLFFLKSFILLIAQQATSPASSLSDPLILPFGWTENFSIVLTEQIPSHLGIYANAVSFPRMLTPPSCD